MAAYWRSPYRELSNKSSYRKPSTNHSTLKFEQSLHLSRARSSINFGRPDLFDPGFRTSTANGSNSATSNSSNNIINPLYRPDGLIRSQTNTTINTTIKGILKPPKTQRTNSILTDDATNNANGDAEKENEVIEPLKKDKKRVRFGGSHKMILNFDSENSIVGHSRCESNALKRLSHSRLIEETAMKKLNRLISGVVSDKPPVLPSVKGTGLLSLNHSNDVYSKPSKSCHHSMDLKCIRCIKKDVETNELEGAFGNDNTANSKISKSLLTTDDKANHIKMKHEEVNNDSGHSKRTENQLGSLDGVQCRSPVSNSNSYSTKRQFRLLPGRYPFTSGAMQIKKLLVTEQNNDQNIGHINSQMVLQSNTVDLHLERAGSQISSSYYLRGNSDRSPSPRMKAGLHRQTSHNQTPRNELVKMPSISLPVSANDHLQLNPSKCLDNNEISKETIDNEHKHTQITDNNVPQPLVDDITPETHKVIGGLGDEPQRDKASEILEWLNDVQRTKTFEYHHTKAIALESQ